MVDDGPPESAPGHGAEEEGVAESERKALRQELAKMDSRDFEYLVGDLWEAMGWTVEVTPETGDDGVDIIARLMISPAPGEELRATADDEWSALHDDAFAELLSAGLVRMDGDGVFEPVPLDEAHDSVDPQYDPLATIFKHGSVPGAHDNSIFALVA